METATEAPLSQISPENAPVPLDQMPPTKVFPWRKVLVSIGMVSMILVILGFFLFTPSHKKQQSSTGVTAAPSPLPTQYLVATTSNSQSIYTSKSNNYYFMFPRSWTVDDVADGLLTIFSPNEEVIQAGVVENPQKNDFDSWFEKNYSSSLRTSFIKTTIANRPAYKSDTMKAAYISLPNDNILSITYTQCEAIHCKPGTLEPQTFEQILTDLKME